MAVKLHFAGYGGTRKRCDMPTGKYMKILDMPIMVPERLSANQLRAAQTKTTHFQ
jgi:hypothetical protein